MGKLKRSRKLGVLPDVVVEFNYEIVPPEDREDLERDTRLLRDGLIQITYTLLDAGERFARWKERLPHGAYLPWVATTGYSDESARRARVVYERFRDTPMLFTDLDLALPETSIVELAKAPDTALEDVLDLVREGAHLDIEAVRTIIQRHKGGEPVSKPGEAEGTGKTATKNIGANGLRRMARAAHDALATEIESRLAELLHFFHEAESRLATKQKLSQEALQKAIRPRAQWLTEALEQLTQRRATSPVKLRHETSLDRQDHEPGPWADVATFLRDVGHSHGWEQRITAANAPEMLQRGRQALEAVLPREKHRHFTQY